MDSLVIPAVLFIISAMVSYFSVKPLSRQLKIRNAIKRNDLLLNQMRKRDQESKFHTYNNLVHYSLLNLREKTLKIPYQELQDMVDKEINNLAGSFTRRIFSSILLVLKFALSIVLFSASFLFLINLVIEYQDMDGNKTAVVSKVESAEKKDFASQKTSGKNGESEKKAELKTNANKEVKEKEQVKEKAKEQVKAKAKAEKQAKAKADADAKAAAKEKEENEVIEKDKITFNKGVSEFNEGKAKDAKKTLEKLKKKSAYYNDAQKVLTEIKESIYWQSVNYPEYSEITKSPQDYRGNIVGFSGQITDIVEYKKKTMIIIGTAIADDYYGIYGSDVLVLYKGKTEFVEGDYINIAGIMKGSYIETEEEAFIGSFLNNSFSFTTSGYIDVNQMPVIIADYIN